MGVKKRIGIITWHNYPNVGSALQAYALHSYINKHNGDALIINYSAFGRPSLWWLRLLVSRFDRFIPKSISKKIHYRFLSFESKFFKETHLYTTIEQLVAQNGLFDTFVCGSDQIWAPNVFNDVYMLSFVDDEKKKVSYAASIGLPYIPNELIEKYRTLLGRFDYISVRERQGADLLNTLFGIKSSVVLDPTLLLTKEDWSLLGLTKKMCNNRYVLCYFLGEQEEHRKIVEDFAKKQGLKVVSIYRFSVDIRPGFITDTDVGPLEFINYIRNADFIFTDSFHGVCFSINLNRNFYVMKRFAENSPINQNSRIENILSLLELKDRLICSVPEDINMIDYKVVNKTLEKLRSESHQFLKQALDID